METEMSRNDKKAKHHNLYIRNKEVTWIIDITAESTVSPEHWALTSGQSRALSCRLQHVHKQFLCLSFISSKNIPKQIPPSDKAAESFYKCSEDDRFKRKMLTFFKIFIE